LLDHGVNGAGQIARGRVGLDDRKCTLDRHFVLILHSSDIRSGAYSGGISNQQGIAPFMKGT
jgi:hypothetical protein